MLAKDLTNPELVKVSRTKYREVFYYDGRKFAFTGCLSSRGVDRVTGESIDFEAEIEDTVTKETSWLKGKTAVYREIGRQGNIIAVEKTEKNRMKFKAKVNVKMEEAKDSTMTSFEWRLKLVKDHGLLLTPRKYGRDYEVRQFMGKWDDSFIKVTSTGKMNLNVKSLLKWCGYNAITCYDAWHRFNDETIKAVIDKVIAAQNKEILKRQNETVKAIESLAG